MWWHGARLPRVCGHSRCGSVRRLLAPRMVRRLPGLQGSDLDVEMLVGAFLQRVFPALLLRQLGGGRVLLLFT